MAKGFSKLIHSLRKSLERDIQNLLISANSEEPSGSAFPNPEKAIEDPQVNNEGPIIDQKLAFRLQAYEKGIWAFCSSCGTAHLLEAVCYACGKPVCSDPYCRVTKHHPQLKRNVVACNECKDTF